MARFRRGRAGRAPRNTAPLWKKLTVVLSAPIAAALLVSALHATKWNFFVLLALIVVVVAAVVWGMAKLLGVHLSLGSWD